MPRSHKKGLPEIRYSVKVQVDPVAHELWERLRRHIAEQSGGELTDGEAHSVALCVHPFTVIGATTDPDQLPSPFLSRFPLKVELDPYTEADLARIVTQAALLWGMEVTAEAAALVASLARGIAREALGLMSPSRDVAIAAGRRTIELEDVERARELLGLDRRGLGPLQQRALLHLKRLGRAGAGRLAALLGISRRMFRTLVEPELVRAGAVHLTARGLVPT
jgi:Holliday junction DNA helicase RuvB